MEVREQIIPLKDGRKLFKTHNEFKFLVEDKKGNSTEVTEEYWKKAKNNRM